MDSNNNKIKIIKPLLILIIVGLLGSISYQQAFASHNSNLMMSTIASTSAPIKTSPVVVKSPALSSADNDVNELNLLKRKTEIQKAVMELKKASNPNGMLSDSQTTAIGVVINQAGGKFATLQFIDGSTLDVELGSSVGTYKVSAIDMSGVRLVNCVGIKCASKLIKRAYPQTAVNNVNTKSKNYTSTPIFGSATTEVPPIVVN